MKPPAASVENILKPLGAAQLAAVDPAEHVWLNASAGTGKTQVLAARVLRLLLDGVSPDSILCITFTKAGAAEMAHRVHERLSLWVDAGDEAALGADLAAIGVDDKDPELRARAKTLFASVIDSQTGAIRVQTIHSFCQSLLASFPFEANILPGFRLIEGSEADELHRTVLAELLGEAGVEGDLRRTKIAALSRRLGEQATREFLGKAARYFQRRPDPRFAPAASDVRLAFGLPEADADQWTAAELATDILSDKDICAVMDAACNWKTQKGEINKHAHVTISAIQHWKSLKPELQSANLPQLRAGLATEAKGQWQLRAAFTKDNEM
jgi:ATP-dependent helicase/nuclease subunit A